MIDLVGLVALGASAAGGVGVATSMQIRRDPVPNPLNGTTTGSPVTQTVIDVLQAEKRRYEKKGDASWTEARVILFVAAQNLSWPPKRGDQATWGGRTDPITSVEEFLPAGNVIGYYLAIGAR